MRPPPRVSVVVSFYNEEAVLGELIRRLRVVLGAEEAKESIAGHELVFVNDDSTDRSVQILREEMDKAKDILIVNMSRNFGVSECVLAGMKHSKGDVVVYLDADLQDPPEVIHEMLEAWRRDEEVEVVYTTRRTRAGESPLKMLITKLGYRLIKSLSEIDLPVDSGDFKLLTRRAVDHLLQLREKKPYLRGLVSWIGFKQVPVLYDREARHDGRENTKFPVMSRRVIYGYLDRALISFSDAPLKLMLFLGFVISFLSLSYIAVVLVQKFMGWHVPGWPAIMAAILFLGGTQIFMLGVLGLYINTIFQESKGRPNYIVKSVITADGEHV